MQNYYTYKLYLPETKEYYFGSRVSLIIPFEDNKYLGSMCIWKPDKSKLQKEILGIWNSKEEAILEEAKLIKEHIKDPLNKNYHIPNLTFNLYTRTSKKYCVETYGEEKGLERYNNICKKRTKTRIKKDNYKCSNETKIKISNSLKGNKPHNTGKQLSEEWKNSISKTWHSDKRMKVMSSKEYKNKMSKSLSGEKNPMYKKSIYDVWLKKYGKEEANKRYTIWINNKKGQIPWNKNINKTKINE
jgi:hypothetical protein